ncbi:hypothetical protein JCM15519_17910 [Fundidesulfovibrio butyratiphilus]
MHQDLPIVILCGGAGTRLRPLTQTIPKTLVPLNGKPMLQHILEYHLRKGHTRFVLCVGYLGDAVRRFVDQAGLDAEIVFSDMGETASMLKRLHGAASHMGERALVTYGDTLIDTGLTAMLQAHLSLGSLITLTTASIRNPFGLVRLDAENRVISFEEKPVQTFYIGQLLIERSVLEALGEQEINAPDGEGLVRLIQNLADTGRVGAFPYSGPQITFNTEQELQKAEKDIITFYTQTH